MQHSIRLGIVGMDEFTDQLLRGILKDDVIPVKNIAIVDKDDKKTEQFEALGVFCCEDDVCTLIKSEIIVISVQKNELGTTLAPINALTRGRVIISTAAGVDCDFILERVTSGTYAVEAVPERQTDGTFVIRMVYSKGFPDYLRSVCADMFESIGTIDVQN